MGWNADYRLENELDYSFSGKRTISSRNISCKGKVFTCTLIIAAGKGAVSSMGTFKEQDFDTHRRLLRDKNIHQRECSSYDQYTAI